MREGGGGWLQNPPQGLATCEYAGGWLHENNERDRSKNGDVGCMREGSGGCLQGYLAHKKLPSPRTLQWAYA